MRRLGLILGTAVVLVVVLFSVWIVSRPERGTTGAARAGRWPDIEKSRAEERRLLSGNGISVDPFGIGGRATRPRLRPAERGPGAAPPADQVSLAASRAKTGYGIF